MPPTLRRSAALSILSLISVAQADHTPSRTPSTSHADAPKVRHAYDPATGRDLLNYPAHRTADLRHTRLVVVVPDMNVPLLRISETIRFSPIARPVASLPLDAEHLNILAASAPDRAVTFSYDPGASIVEFRFDPPVPLGTECELRIDYEVHDAAEGVVWTPESPLFPGRPASFHTQGQPESNRYWIIGHDHPNERLTSEMVVTVPAGYTTCSNGRLVSTRRTTIPGSAQAAEQFHFLQDREHAPYLISLAVGKYDVFDVSGRGSNVPMPVYVPKGEAREPGNAKAVFARTPRMVALFERLFDEPYPWDKYAQVIVTNFAWGGMENTSSTHLHSGVLLDKASLIDGDQDELIAHELAHQWFGNLLTCRSWEHIWLNEGWATYAEALWEQYKDNTSISRPPSGADPASGLRADNDAYLYHIWSSFRSVIDTDHADAPYQPAMASKEYAEAGEVFDRAANPYPKGAAVLHMLRRKLGDPAFFRATAAYIDAHRNRPVETDQFRHSFEKVSGLSLQRFFDQWCHRPGVPRLTVTPTWNSEARTLDFTLSQDQNIDGSNPAFAFDLTIAWSAGARVERATRFIQTREDMWSVPCAAEPEWIAVNPDLDVLAHIRTVLPARRLIALLDRGPTIAARLDAARQLGQSDEPAAVAALARLARDGRAFVGLRRAALESLGEIAERDPARDAAGAAVQALRSINPRDLSEARVRREWVEQTARAAANADQQTRDACARLLLERWSSDRSIAVRAESLRELGRLKSAAALDAFDLALRTDSHEDQIREGAIEGLGDFAFLGALDKVLPFAAPNHPPNTRRTALRAAVKLADQDSERVFNVLAATINQAEVRTRRAAIEGLLELGDPRSPLQIEQFIAATRSNADRRWAEDKLRRWRESRTDGTHAAGAE